MDGLTSVCRAGFGMVNQEAVSFFFVSEAFYLWSDFGVATSVSKSNAAL